MKTDLTAIETLFYRVTSSQCARRPLLGVSGPGQRRKLVPRLEADDTKKQLVPPKGSVAM